MEALESKLKELEAVIADAKAALDAALEAKQKLLQLINEKKPTE